MDEVRDGLCKGVVVIPPDFNHDVAEGRIAQIGLFTDNVDSIALKTSKACSTRPPATVRSRS